MTGMNGVVSTPYYYYDAPTLPAQPQKKDVRGHVQHITETYEKKGAAAATLELAVALRDPELGVEQRKQLLTDLRPVIDKVARDLGENARRKDLPASGRWHATAAIDDQEEYRATLFNLASAIQASGHTEEARRIAGALLSHTAANRSGGNAPADGLDLLGDGLRSLHATQPLLTQAVIYQLNIANPQSPGTNSVLALPLSARQASAGALLPTAAVPDAPAADGDTPLAGARAYTAQALKTAQEAERLADELEREFGKQNPQQDPTGWTMYTTRRSIANQEWAKVEQAFAAELRLLYNGDPKNKLLVENAAHDLAYRYRGDTDAQSRVNKALQTVLTETPLQRDTHLKLYDVNKAHDKLNALIERKKAGQSVADHELTAAASDYDAKQKLLLQALQKELRHGMDSLSPQARRDQSDIYRHVAAGILARYADDLELEVVLDAAVIITKAVDAQERGPEGQMQVLGDLTPAKLDPTARQLVMGDQRIKDVVTRYVDWAAGSVTTAYDKAAQYYEGINRKPDYERLLFEGTPPALAATMRLREVTDHNARRYVTPEIAARIINKLREDKNGGQQSTLARVIDDLALTGKYHRVLLDKDNPHPAAGPVYDYPTYNKVIVNLSFALESAARGSGSKPMQWDSPEIQRAIEGVGGDVAKVLPRVPFAVDMHSAPYPSRFDPGFRQAAAEGSVVLALEVARQLRMQTGRVTYDGQDGKVQADRTLEHVAEGLKLLQKSSEKLFDEVNQNLAPFSVPVASYGVAMTEEQTQRGIDALTGEFRSEFDKVKQDRGRLDRQGYLLWRVGENISFYQPALGESYGTVDKPRVTLLDSEKIKQTVWLSDSAQHRMGTQIARRMLDEDLQQGFLRPQKYGLVAQTGDLAEFLTETYVIQRPVQRPDGTWAREGRFDDRAGLRVTRVGYHPTFGPLLGAGLWGVEGAFQLALTGYIYDHVKFDAGQEYRKLLLLGVVGGFAGFHLYHAGAVFAHWGAGHLHEGTLTYRLLKQAAPGIFADPNADLAKWTAHLADATQGLTKSLSVIMGIAVLWDASGVYHNATDQDSSNDFRVATHGANLVADWMLLRVHLATFWQKTVEARVKTLVAQGVPQAAAEKRAVAEVIDTGLKKFVHNKWEIQLFEHALRRALGKLGTSLGTRVALGTNPFGWAVNIIYLVTTLIHFVHDQNKYINKLEGYDKKFLTGAGLSDSQAEELKQHDWWSGEGKGIGVVLSYLELSGDPAQFLSWLNGMPVERLRLMVRHTEAFGRGDEKELPDTAQDDYWMLPLDPHDPEQRKHNPNLVYNAQEGAWEDTKLKMRHSGHGRWHSLPSENRQPGYYGGYQPQITTYDAGTQLLTGATGYYAAPVSFKSKAGLRTWMEANDIAMPPAAPPVTAQPQPELPPAPATTQPNVYVVKGGDNLWKIAGNDPNIVRQIYQLNPWLNQRLEESTTASGAGRNPHIINAGEKIILPPGYRVPQGN